ncbi:MAG: cation transporter [Sandaracinus sp.]|nr:cation transporter [Sandaracinus sp.]|tara:strand:+ start:4011 stop:4535 length:525 start_codon:yes stop_codon:yes gene_type:complete
MVAARMTRTLVTAGLLAAVWVAWSWHFEPLIVGFGVVAVALTVFLARRLQVLDEETVPFEINLRLFVYLPWLAWEVVKANWQVAKVILNPKLPIRPHLIRVPADQRTTLGKVILANTITITPGTISLDLRDGVILVHCLDDDLADQDSSGTSSRMIHFLEKRVHEDHPPEEGEA